MCACVYLLVYLQICLIKFGFIRSTELHNLTVVNHVFFNAFPSPSFNCSKRSPLQVGYIAYMDSLAALIGARPNILWLLLKDIRLGLQVFLGPCTPYQFRLSGPGQWAGARKTILTQWERVTQPFRTRVVPVPEAEPSHGHKLRLMLAVSGGAAALIGCFCLHMLPPLPVWGAQ